MYREKHRNSMRKVRNDFIDQNSRQSVFVMIVARCKKHVTKNIVKEYPGILTIFRSDGRLGFPGGGQEKSDIKGDIITEDDLKTTAIRECKEEIGYEIKFRNNLKKFSSYISNNNYQITSFVYFVTEEELNSIYENYHNNIGSKFADELFGLNKLLISTKHIYEEVLRQNFKSTAKKDLIELIEQSDMLKNK